MKNRLMKSFSVEIVRYIFVGIILVLVDISIFYISNQLGAHYLLSQSLSLFACSLVGSRLFRNFVFLDDEKKRSINSNFVLLNTFNMMGFAASYILLYIFIDKIKLDTLDSKLFTTLILTIFNYLTRKYIIFV
jgi:putative flippase GtrA